MVKSLAYWVLKGIPIAYFQKKGSLVFKGAHAWQLHRRISPVPCPGRTLSVFDTYLPQCVCRLVWLSRAERAVTRWPEVLTFLSLRLFTNRLRQRTWTVPNRGNESTGSFS